VNLAEDQNTDYIILGCINEFMVSGSQQRILLYLFLCKRMAVALVGPVLRPVLSVHSTACSWLVHFLSG
jgi:hypothetical protein